VGIDKARISSEEAGVKLGNAEWQFEAIGFFNDYTNMVGTCTASTGGNCNIGDQFDGGGVDVKGLEMLAATTLGDSTAQGGPAFPVSLAYTYTNARFQSDFVSGYEAWGNVQAGDRLPYLPTHQIALNAGVELDRMRLNTAVNWVSETRSTAGQGPIAIGDRIDARVLVDLSAEFDLTDNVSVYGTAQNVLGETYNAGFSPSGARPGGPRLWMAGLRARI
jgi:Fe(3+) dicitrate transport protein